MDTLHPWTERVIQRIPKELDEADSKDIWGRSPNVPQMSREDEDHSFHRGWGGDQKDPQASWPLSPKGQTPSRKVKPPSVTISIDDSDSQVPCSAPSFYPDPDYPMDSYRISKPHGVTPTATISAIDVLFSDHPKCLDSIFIYLLGPMISTGNLRLLKLASIADK